MTAKLCEGRVVVVTGAGRGLGRAYALEFARHGAAVVVNDLGVYSDGGGVSSCAPADAVVEEIRSLGGVAMSNGCDVADFEGARELVDSAVAAFGQIDVLVTNAGILRDRTIVNMTAEEWDAVIRVHLRGTFAPAHWAAMHWRDRAKSYGPVQGRLITTSSSSGLYGSAGQANYSAAKAGIASFTLVASKELERYGVTANAIYPTALSRLTEDLFRDRIDPSATADGFEPLDPGNVAPFVVWLGSAESGAITGRVFGVRGGRILVANGWEAGPSFDVGRRWDATELGDVVRDLVSKAPPNAGVNGLRETATP